MANIGTRVRTIPVEQPLPRAPSFIPDREQEVTAARSFAEMLDRCIKVCEKLEAVEEKKQGTLATALATEMDVSLAKTEQLITRLAAIKRAMQKRRGQMALNGAKSE